MATATDAFVGGITNATNTLTNAVTNAFSNAQNNAAALTSTSFVNLAPTEVLDGGVVLEIKSPNLPKGGYYYTAGSQTLPGLSRGALVNSSLLNNNNDLSHVCDFKFDFHLGIDIGGLTNPFTDIAKAIQAGKMAGANAVRAAVGQLQQAFREGLQALLAALNFDPTGQISLTISVGKSLIRKLQAIEAQVLQIVYDISLIQSIATNLEQIVTWIKSLPGQIQKLLQQCLTNFQTSLTNTNNTIKNATNIKNIVNNIGQQASNAAAAESANTSASMMAIINGTAGTAAITSLINSTVASAPPSSGATQKTASSP